MNRYLAPCILPFARCVYANNVKHRADLHFCDEIEVGPHNSDAKCFKLTWKKQMIERSLDSRVVKVKFDWDEEE